MEQSGGEVADDEPPSEDAGAGNVDLLSALPDDILLLILVHLEATDAARTSVLSRRLPGI